LTDKGETVIIRVYDYCELRIQMALTFRSIRSGSSGNCLLIHSEKTRVLIDCGLGSQYACKQTLSEFLGPKLKVDACIVTHTHGDHVNYSSLRVFQQNGICLRLHEKCLTQLIEKHYNGYRFDDLVIEPFDDEPFEIGDLHFEPIPLRHEPQHPTYGFAIRQGSKLSGRKMVAATDFTVGPNLASMLVDSDFIFIESNHDLKLLAQHPNFASKFHMPNPRTAEMLFNCRTKSRRPPQCVMLGHLSEERNRESIALDTVRSVFNAGDLAVDFPLLTAPRYNASDEITLD
jgi:phosphoribosyl 1,2-cyclic phosphodiesterase